MTVILLFALASVVIIDNNIDNQCHLPTQSTQSQTEWCDKNHLNVDMRVGTIDNVFIITKEF